ncbi:MAG: chromate transporter [Porphyromonas sp.]|nr:chromate transporter [Bacteroidales bacterium]MDD7558897.1 chromate transporter [Bacteroidales bacterium]MDY3101383.1 chromate transporter [Porphyromonas sp.]
MVYWYLFLVYLKIGLLGFGGGYAMLTLIQEEVVERYGWLTIQEFTDIVAISQMTPGPIGVNSATYIGYVVTGNVWGSILATVSVMIPSFVLVLVISLSFAKFRSNPHVEAVFTGIRPAAVGLIAAAAMLLMNEENFIDFGSYIFFGLTLIAVLKNWLHPILLIVLAGLGGYFVYSGIF